MAFEFNKTTFGKKTGTAAATQERAKSQIWMNVGYSVDVEMEEDGKPVNVTKFISLPVGMALDEVEHVNVNSRSAEYTALASARNDLLDQVMEAAKKLAPGEERILKLEVQLRRIQGDSAPVPAKDNPFGKKLDL